MKHSTKFSFLAASLICIGSVVAGPVEDCAGMNHPQYQEEYKACLKVSIAEKMEPRDKKVCEALKGTNDVYKTYLYAESLGAVQVNDFHGAMYKNTNDKVNKFIDDKCSSMDAAKLVDESNSLCYSTCNAEAAAIFKKDKKKLDLQQKNCHVICTVDNMAKTKLLDGVSIERKNRAPADCSNPSNDAISNLGRNAKEVIKRSPDLGTKGPEGRQR